MTWSDVQSHVYGAVVALLAGIASGVVWLVKRIFTDQKRIDLLEREAAYRDRLRLEDREALREVKDSVKRIENKLMEM